MSTIYVVDTNSFRVFGNYYPESFPSFWAQVDALAGAGLLLSCREVAKELELQSPVEHLNTWVSGHAALFAEPTSAEMDYVAKIFRVKHFRQLIGQKQLLKGLPVADPFLVARGAALGACVVTEETLKVHAAKIPNVCEYFRVKCVNAQGFLAEVGWRF
jgi:hypothetical protein